MARIWIKETINKTGENVEVDGWVAVRRDHGKLVFIDLVDITGTLQIVFAPASTSASLGGPGNKELLDLAGNLRANDVVKISGKISSRPEKMVNPNIETGKVELQASELEILNKSEPAPFEVYDDGKNIGEEYRLKYRYLDLRRERMKKNLKKRHLISQFIRNYLTDENFTEIETPILTKSTPEGARDYVVPSRLHSGKFYALPQSPQQYKQLLMVGGLERYFQLARCFRDEDTRGDRQPEFTQLDVEMSFVEREDVMALNEDLLINLVEKIYPEKHVQDKPFPRLSYKEAMANFGTDRPDLRKDKNDPDLLAFCWIIDFPFFEKGKDGGWTFTHNPFSAPKPEFMENLLQKRDITNILTSQYDVILNGWEIGGGSIRNHNSKALMAVFEIMGYEKTRIRENFGHMLEALSFGAPPHGGIAWGLDRVVMILQNEPNIRETIAFPKTGDGRDLMMDSPSDISKTQLKELHLKIEEPPKKS